MSRIKGLIALAGLIVGGWFFLQHFKIEGLDQLQVQRKDGAAETTPASRTERAAPPVARTANTIRIASFNIQVFGESKLDKPQVVDILADVIRRFDIVAVQEIRAKGQDVLPRFVDKINSTGRHYQYVLGPRLGRTSSKEQYAFIYDAQSIEVDQQATYTVNDPHGLLHRPPLVSAFRVRGPSPEEAFTFSLVNIHTDPDETDTEVCELAKVWRGVRADGRNEDDVILLGDLNVDDKHLGELGRIPGIAWLISGTTTNTRGTKLYDNIILHQASTAEFTGRAGVLDLMDQFNLTMDQALEVSDHLPIWAEFEIYEAAGPGRLTQGAAETTRK